MSAANSFKSYIVSVCLQDPPNCDTLHLLLRAGGDPDGGPNVSSPPIVLLLHWLYHIIHLGGSGLSHTPGHGLPGLGYRGVVVLLGNETVACSKVIGAIRHLIKAGADVNKRVRTGIGENGENAVEVLERILRLDMAGQDEIRVSGQAMVSEAFSIRVDATGQKTIKCRTRVIDSWLR